MEQEALRFKKSRRSAANSDCVEVAHTLGHLRDSKNGATLTANLRPLLRAIKDNRF